MNITLLPLMSAQELDRYTIIKKVIEKELKGSHTPSLLSLSLRQCRRLIAGVRAQGARFLIHRNRGVPSNHHLSKKEEKNIVKLISTHYHDFTPTFASEKLREQHGIIRDRKTIARIMIDVGVWEKKRKKKKEVHRAWRQRRPSLGELLQFDGSYHHWLEDRGEESCLLATIDDATGKILMAHLDASEGVVPVFSFWRDYINTNGKPRSIYLDRFSTYKMTQKIAQENPDLKTQFQRAMSELHIEPIFALSPQAKGRVERLFQTLQDRLVKELRLAHISTLEDANRFIQNVFIPDFNKRFSVVPFSSVNLHTPLTDKEQKNLSSIFSRQETRKVRNDFTVAFKTTWYQLTKKQSVTVCKGDRLIIEERLDGSLQMRLRNQYLHFEPILKRPDKWSSKSWVIPKSQPATTEPHRPAKDHPWRHPYDPKKIAHTFIK